MNDRPHLAALIVSTWMLSILGPACGDKEGDDTAPPGDGGGADGGGLDGGTTDGGGGDGGGTSSAAPPCAGETWGFIDADRVDQAIHVRTDGSDDGDGSLSAPVQSLAAALALSRAEGGARRLAIGPGEFEAQLDLSFELGDEGLVIEGCGPTEVRLLAAAADEAVLRVTEATGVVLEGFAIEGGQRSLWFWREAEVTLDAVEVFGASRAGVVIDGSNTGLTATDLVVDDVSADADGLGFGILIQAAQVSLVGGRVSAATRVGILIDDEDALVDLVDVEVSNTAQGEDGSLGRGVQVQGQAEARLSGLTLRDNADAAVFVLASYWVELEALDVQDTAHAEVPGVDAEAGDGIVVSQGDLGEAVSSFRASVVDSSVTGSARAGIVLDGVTASALSGNLLSDNGYAPVEGAVLAQGGADVTAAVDTVSTLDEALLLNTARIDLDDLTD
ncbi:hypothetical protein L6R53_28985 [Myxococcota bacterium]|nr:hypothetical protein [Myxococcota bacterium]